MRYLSTRGGVEPLTFTGAVMAGLAADGGLFLPDPVPAVDESTLERWAGLSYPRLAAEVIGMFTDDLDPAVLAGLLDRSYAVFTHPEVTPLVDCGGFHVLELFHGPTLAFKDVALQFLGNLFEHLLERDNGWMNIIGATSGDTGSAAIHGVRGRKGINIFILHPHGRVSPVQALQMTTVTDANVFNIAIRGTFDDGQAIVKAILGDSGFKERYRLGAVNSINWARIVAQVVYYIHAALRLRREQGAQTVDFSVPTGNFGDIFAGYVARMMTGGLIGRLILATNANDILSRFVNQGVYARGTVVQTLSPSMDIQVASNFERYLFYLYGRDPQRVAEAVNRFAAEGSISFSPSERELIKRQFAAASVGEEETLATIRKVHGERGYLLDPHTAVGVAAALRHRRGGVPVVCLATAHPAKFGDAVRKAIGRDPDPPPPLAGLDRLESRCEILPADENEVRRYLAAHALTGREGKGGTGAR